MFSLTLNLPVFVLYNKPISMSLFRRYCGVLDGGGEGETRASTAAADAAEEGQEEEQEEEKEENEEEVEGHRRFL